MTDKELKKLSRLELLELLLEVSKENEKLKEKIEELKIGNKTTQNIENLSVVTRQAEDILKYASSIADLLKKNTGEAVAVSSVFKNERETLAKADPQSDKEIYCRILSFFAKYDDKLKVFPADIENDVRARIKSILERKKT